MPKGYYQGYIKYLFRFHFVHSVYDDMNLHKHPPSNYHCRSAWYKWWRRSGTGVANRLETRSKIMFFFFLLISDAASVSDSSPVDAIIVSTRIYYFLTSIEK